MCKLDTSDSKDHLLDLNVTETLAEGQ